VKRLIVLAAGVAAAVIAIAALTSSGSSSAAVHVHPQSTATIPPELAPMLADARVATAKYANSLARAKADGYRTIVTQHIPDMGWHFMNPEISEFDVKRPPILVYLKHGKDWQLVAFEWVFPEAPVTPPLPGATYGSFGAACHYVDGTFVFESSQSDCAPRSPTSDAKFGFWHPDLVTLHLWAWYPNSAGIYNGTNPLVAPFND
jgi:hypothetical protein